MGAAAKHGHQRPQGGGERHANPALLLQHPEREEDEARNERDEEIEGNHAREATAGGGSGSEPEYRGSRSYPSNIEVRSEEQARGALLLRAAAAGDGSARRSRLSRAARCYSRG